VTIVHENCQTVIVDLDPLYAASLPIKFDAVNLNSHHLISRKVVGNEKIRPDTSIDLVCGRLLWKVMALICRM
jgi:hypothetical protein